jgi:uncharacterized membrane protein YhaH (DUF805 family)
MLSPAQVKELFSWRGRASKHQFRFLMIILIVLLWFFSLLSFVPRAGMEVFVIFLSPPNIIAILFSVGSVVRTAPISFLFYIAYHTYTVLEIVYYILFLLIPSIIMYSISIPLIVRRYHDLDLSGWRIFLDFVPFAVGFDGFLFVFGMSFANGTPYFKGHAWLAQELLQLFTYMALFSAGFFFYRLYTFFFVDGTAGPNRFGVNPIDPSMPD